MNRLIGEEFKFGMAVAPATAAPGAIAVSRAFPMSGMRKALFQIVLSSTDMQAGDVLDIGVVGDDVNAPAATGDLAALNATNDALIYENITANTRATRVSVETAASADGAITINGVEFPYDATPAAGTREWDDAAALAAAINAADMGLTAVATGTVVTISSTIPDGKTITLTETVTAIIAGDVLTLEAVALLEVDASRMGDAERLVVVVDNLGANTGTVTAAVSCIRLPDFKPAVQAVAVNAHL